MAADCIFCKIAAKEIPSQIIYETDQVIAFADANPQAPVHLLMIPKEHISNIMEITASNQQVLVDIGVATQELAKEYQLEEGFRVVSNCGVAAGQTVQHLHFHLLGGRELQWPPG